MFSLEIAMWAVPSDGPLQRGYRLQRSAMYLGVHRQGRGNSCRGALQEKSDSPEMTRQGITVDASRQLAYGLLSSSLLPCTV
jgi:hypothetical protein